MHDSGIDCVEGLFAVTVGIPELGFIDVEFDYGNPIAINICHALEDSVIPQRSGELDCLARFSLNKGGDGSVDFLEGRVDLVVDADI